MLNRLPWSLLVANLVLNSMYAGLAAVVVPALLAGADEANKEWNLAWVMAASSVATMVVHPVAGALSDRVATPWGRRTPWIVTGALASGVAMLSLGRAETVLAVAVGWLLVQPLLNTVEAPLNAVLADRVPVVARPAVSAKFAGGGAVGLAVGTVVAGALVTRIPLLTAGLAGVFVATMVTFVVINPDRTAVRQRRPLRWRDAARSRGFRLVFAARFLITMGSQLVLGYLLYIVMDRTGTDAETGGETLPLVVGVHIVCIVVGALLVARRIGDRRVQAVLLATAVIVMGLLLPVVVPGMAGLVAYAIVSGLGRGAFLTADLALVLDVLPSSDDAGRDLAVFGLATVLPQSVAPVLAGALLAATGNTYTALFVVAAILAASSMVVLAPLLRPAHSPSSP